MATVYDKSSLFLAPSGVSNGTVFVQKPVPIYGSEQVTNGDFSQTGAELVTNGDFATDTNWVKGTGWSIGDGVASRTAQSGSTACDQNISLTANKTYKIVYDLTITSGGFFVRLAGTTNVNGASRTTSGTYTDYLTAATGNNQIRLVGENGSFIGSIDNVSVKELGQDWSLDSGWSIGDNKSTFNLSSGAGNISQSNVFESGKTYKITFDTLETNGGNLAYRIGAAGFVFINAIAANTKHTITETATSPGGISLRGASNFNGSITNISVQEVLSPDGDFTFTRGSNLSATRVNEAQLIEKGRENLLVQSNQFDTTWAAGGTITIVGGQSDKDGGTDAWLLSKTSAWSYLRQSITPSGVNTFSVYAKANASSYMLMRVSGPNNPIVYFNLSSGAVSLELNNIGATIESVGSGWYRCSIVTDISITDVRVYPTEVNTAGAATGSIYIQDAQLEQGLVATSVITTNAGTVQAGILENTPRLDYSGGATCPSLLLEPSRTNALVNSEYFPSWDKNQVTLYGGYSAPDGTNSAYKITKNGTQSYLLIPGNSTSSDARSIYARTTSGTGQVNLTSHNSNTNSLFTITEEWQRFDVTSTPSISVNYYAVDFRAGDLDEIIIWGAQQEVGSYPTSYIPTYGTSQTRAGEICNSTEDATTINSTEGVLYFEVSGFENDLSDRYISISDGTLNNAIRIFYYQDGGTTFFRKNVNGAQTTIVTTSAINKSELTKIAVKYNSTNFDIFSNGVKISTNLDSNSFPIGTLNEINFSNADGINQPFYGKTKQLIYFPAALSDLECEILTGATTYETFDEMALALNYTVYE